jgi:hypothetical protein
MHRGIRIALASAALVATVGMTALAAQPSPFSVKVSPNTIPGERLQVQVIENPAVGTQSVKYRASAVVHFASGDVSVKLVPDGNSLVASVKVPVGADEKPQTVTVDVTVTAGSNSIVLHGSGAIKSVKSSR